MALVANWHFYVKNSDAAMGKVNFYSLSNLAQLISVLCIYNTMCHCFIKGNHLMLWRNVNWVQFRLAFALLNLLDTVHVSFCKTVIGAPLDGMQGPHPALRYLNHELKKKAQKCVWRDKEQVHSDCKLELSLVLVKPF